MTGEVWITFNGEDVVPEGVPLQVKLRDGRRVTATYERRGSVVAWWLKNGEPTGFYNVVAYRRPE